MSPDPQKIKRDNFNTSENIVINQMEEEMDVDVEENLGYVQLQNNEYEELPANDSTDEEEESDEENESFQPQFEQPPPNVTPIISSSAQIQAEVWNAPTVSTIEITSEKSQEITKIMSEFKLPNAPDWINEINTETLVNRLKNRQQ